MAMTRLPTVSSPPTRLHSTRDSDEKKTRTDWDIRVFLAFSGELLAGGFEWAGDLRDWLEPKVPCTHITGGTADRAAAPHVVTGLRHRRLAMSWSRAILPH